ncbi:2-methylcitrate dehydratase [Thalassobaculum fulvum]|uniref:2-methylcitrate dehydratase n=1 Tax=Thalassobaculum fulvum TaxID=1633335 RepID=A0A918XR64_9PROT|nr:MmgE/PrpD family protein [Thalassobaculum fulvum]GHD46210.1 2-methylcitrate dehydratase [Thalassobaculum fulvum]
MTDAIERFADHVVSTRYEDIPADAIRAAKIFILDSLGVGLAGTRAPWVREWIGSTQAMTPGEGARVWGTGEMLPAPAAAGLNGYLIHNSEFDCIHEEAVLHPMAVPFAALMAEAEARGSVDGRALLRAVILGVDVACHIGAAVNNGLRFFRPAVGGGFGAVAAIAVAIGLDRDRLLDAFGLYYAQAGGTMQAHTEGSPLLAMQVGFNARNAVTAVRLAEAGIPGLRGTLEGPFGYLKLMEGDYDAAALTAKLGRVWRIAEVAHKPFPSGRATHGIMDALRELTAEHGFAGAEVEAVSASVPPLINHLIGRPPKRGMTQNYARLCGAYASARLLLNGTLGVDDFTEAALNDPETLDLAGRVAIAPNGNPDPNALTPVTVEVRLRSGATVSRSIPVVYGNPAKPLTREAHLAKFRTNLGFAAGPVPTANAETLIAMVDDLETLDDARRLVDLVVAA